MLTQGRTFSLVRQEDPCGCVVASLAMVTGQTYADVRAAWPPSWNFETGGLDHFEAQHYLGDRFIPHIFRWRFELGRCGVTMDGVDQRVVRSDWPRPFAPAHIIGINGGRHAVVLLADETVLDPQIATPRRLSEVGDVSYMLGVWPDIRLSMPRDFDG